MSDDLVTLRCGMTLPISAITLAVDLEFRGWRLRKQGEKLSVTGGRDDLTDQDRTLIRTHRDDLVRIAEYTPPSIS